MASLYPVQFLELVVMRPAYYACIGLELCGFTHFCWVLAAGMARLFRMKKEAGAVVVQVTGISTISIINIISIMSKLSRIYIISILFILSTIYNI